MKRNLLWKHLRASIFAFILFLGSSSIWAQTSNYLNDFETGVGLNDWANANRVTSGTNGIPAAGGNWYGIVPATQGGASTRFGGYNHVFPACGYKTSLDIYLDINRGYANDTRVDYSSAISNVTPNSFRRDFIFHIGFYSDATGLGAGTNRFIISGSNTAPGWPRNPARPQFLIPSTGWYRFEHSFRNNAGVLAVDLNVYTSGNVLVGSLTLSDPTDIIGSTVGGNRYGWVLFNGFNPLGIDNSSLTVNDADFDGICDNVDNCPTTPNPGQANTGGTPAGDACEDRDGDGVTDGADCAPDDILRWRTANFYRDYDGDGYDDGLYTRCYGELGTQGPEFYEETLGPDCNDNDKTVHSPQPYYVDSDGDGYGAGSVVMLCSSTAPAGYSTNNTDCAPDDILRWRTANFYRDYDGDGYDDGLYTRCYGELGTQGPEFYEETLGPDCNDNDKTVHSPQPYYVDSDGDGYGAGSVVMLCSSTAPAGYSTNNTDCAPDDILRWRTANFYRDYDGDGYDDGLYTRCYGELGTQGPEFYEETLGPDCNDNDPAVHVVQTWYQDQDNDGHAVGTTQSCNKPVGQGWSTTPKPVGDCNDNNPNAWQFQAWYLDKDNDGRAVATTQSCGQPVGQGWSTTPKPVGDCNDNDATIYNGAPELCDGKDNNCNGQVDEGFVDTDGDGIKNCMDTDDDGDGTPDTYDCEPLNKKNNKYLVCHKGETICVDKNGWENGHKKHLGDYLGACSTNVATSASEAAVVEPEMIVKGLTLKAFPNPTNNYFTLTMKSMSADKVQVKVYDVVGREVFAASGAANETYTFGEKFAKGNYLVRVLQADKQATVKLTKQ